MDSIEEILNRATITFPNPLSFANTEKLLHSISEGIQGEVYYSLDYPKSFVYNENEKKSKVDVKGVNIGKIVIKDTKNNAYEVANLTPSHNPLDEKFIKYSSMRFDIVPGWKLSDYKEKGILKLWDDVREIVSYYFQHKEDIKEKGFSE
jgi:hypothetical protein